MESTDNKKGKTDLRLAGAFGFFGLATLIDLLGNLCGPELLHLIAKPLLMSSLALCVLLYLKKNAVFTSRHCTLIAALLFGCAGDILLMFPSGNCFLAGMGAFFAGHVFYYCTLPCPFRGRTGLEKILSLLILAAIIAGIVSLASVFKVPGFMGICVTAYSCAFAFLIHASLMAAWRNRSRKYVLTALGFLIFAVSDSMVAAANFTDFRLPCHGFWVMSTYILAQFIVSMSLACREKEEKDSEYGVRLQRLDALRDSLRRHEDELYAAFDKDFGKGPFETYTTEIGFLYNGIRHIRKHLRKWMEPRPAATPLVLWPAQCRIYPEPYGKVLVIGPFNYPLQLTLAPLAVALAAGNTVTVKCSRQTPEVSRVISALLSEAFPEEVVEIVPDSVSNDRMLERRFDYIFFTGSPRVGSIVMEAAAKHLTPVTLELGGKSPAIVCESADLRLACERIARGKFLNAGQTCVAPDYVLVHKSVHKKFIETMKEVVKDFFGDTSSRPSEMTLVATGRHWERIMGLIPSEDDPSARTVIGGNGDSATKYIAPTVLDDCSWDAKAMQEEIFGPVLPVIEYEDLDSEVIARIKAGEKPLALYLFTRCGAQKRKVLSGISFGGGCVNETILHLGNENMPFGGVGNSGMGAYHGKTGFETFSHLKSVMFKSSLLNFDLLKPPYAGKLGFIRKLYR
ncbi:MAG: aldehyde dehydrogenase family protein [Candidatus Cryptobacteroides sp.]